jgi:hypothetical protein
MYRNVFADLESGGAHLICQPPREQNNNKKNTA